MSSESDFDINMQPSDTCPCIDGLLDSVANIGELDDEDEIIEVDPDFRSWSSARDNVEELKLWQEAWLEIGEELIDRFDDIIAAIDFADEEYNDQKLTEEQNAYYYFFNRSYDDIESYKEKIKEHIESWKSSISFSYFHLEQQHSEVISLVEKNDYSVLKEIEEYRSLVSGFRSEGNGFKEEIRDFAYDFLPEKCRKKDFITQYDEKMEEEDLKKSMKDLSLIKDNIKNKNKKIKPN